MLLNLLLVQCFPGFTVVLESYRYDEKYYLFSKRFAHNSELLHRIFYNIKHNLQYCDLSIIVFNNNVLWKHYV